LALLSLGSFLFLSCSLLAVAEDSSVRMWEEELVIPTYLAGPADPNPMFFFGRASQGAEGRIYPYPLYDNLTNKKVDKTYNMVYLENEYIRIGVLPEIGGRIFEGVDKTNGYDFFYRQHVIKPALIGLIGAWISGGVEWNIPHHHRASTFIPVQYRLEENADGSRTVWVGELELRHRMRWAVGYTLQPGKSYLETSLRILNRTPVVNSLLCFANVAVHVNEDYQVIFPPSTQYVTHHSKREFTTWPISNSRYGGANFDGGVDVSWFKNHISSNSMFAWNYEDDFLAGYDHGKQAGTMSVANHHITPGKKLWTWGNGPEGRLWDTILTDEDGPYLELMVGAFSDNQPDYSWLQPYEVKSFKQYWYPFRGIEGVKNANLDAAVNLDVKEDGTAKLGFYTTSAYSAATVTLKAGNNILLQEQIEIAPDKPYLKQAVAPTGTDPHDLCASLAAEGKELVSYTPIRLESIPMPEPVRAPETPEKIETNEELYLTGLWIEQFHNPALDPDPYWEEALRRDPGDARVNIALGTNYLKRARFAEAEALFRKALERLTFRYTSPKDGEAFYYLGVALKAQGRLDEAFDAFYKAIWSEAWKAAGYYSLAEIASLKGDASSALDLVEHSLDSNALNVRALNLKAALLRHLGQEQEASDVLATAFRRADPLDVRTLFETWLIGKNSGDHEYLLATLNHHPETGFETAVEYMNAGLWQDAAFLLNQMIAAVADPSNVSPMVYYYLGFVTEKLGESSQSAEYYTLAEKRPIDYVFPFQYEAIDALRQAMEVNPEGGRAPYLLGNLLFDWQPDEAIRLWEKSVAMDESLSIALRNLAAAYSRKEEGNALQQAIACLEKAVAQRDKYSIHFFELDQLYEAAGTPPEKRLALLEANHEYVRQRDDALAREITLKVFMGKYDDAIALMQGRRFNIWEGGARFNVSDCWTDAHLLRGHEHLAAGGYQQALDDYQAALAFPENLRSERRGGGETNAEVSYWTGVAYEKLGDSEKAKQCWEKGSPGERPRGRRRGGFFMPGRDVERYYQALALRKLGEEEKSREMFQSLVDAGTEAMKRTDAGIDIFAKFADQQFQRAGLAEAHFTAALGYLGLGQNEKAEEELKLTLQASPDHLRAKNVLADYYRSTQN
jgi:tetratricopeptide (TPR) repeat protein